MADHANTSGLLCAGGTPCPFCKRCPSCNHREPGPATADVVPPDGLAMFAQDICDSCARWLRDVERVREGS